MSLFPVTILQSKALQHLGLLPTLQNNNSQEKEEKKDLPRNEETCEITWCSRHSLKIMMAHPSLIRPAHAYILEMLLPVSYDT